MTREGVKKILTVYTRRLNQIFDIMQQTWNYIKQLEVQRSIEKYPEAKCKEKIGDS